MLLGKTIIFLTKLKFRVIALILKPNPVKYQQRQHL